MGSKYFYFIRGVWIEVEQKVDPELGQADSCRIGGGKSVYVDAGTGASGREAGVQF